MFADLILVPTERLLRELYWNWPELRRWRRRRERAAKPGRQQCKREELRHHLSEIGVTPGALAMVHTGMNGVEIIDEDSRGPSNAIVQAQSLMEDLVRLVGSEGTLVMPTHARYQTDDPADKSTAAEVTTYAPRRSPCGVGLVNELFWRRNGVQRSLFPFNMLAAYGPLAGELLQGNLNEQHPSAHGVHSGYYRICQSNGLVVSVGVPLRDCITIVHVVEEVRADWQIEDFFVEHRYRVVEDGVAREWTVRLRRDEYAQFAYCRNKLGRDLVAANVIHEGRVGTVRVDWARAGEVFNFLWRKTSKRPYPYYGLWMMRKPWRKRA